MTNTSSSPTRITLDDRIQALPQELQDMIRDFTFEPPTTPITIMMSYDRLQAANESSDQPRHSRIFCRLLLRLHHFPIRQLNTSNKIHHQPSRPTPPLAIRCKTNVAGIMVTRGVG